MTVFSRVIFTMVQWAARKGLAADPSQTNSAEKHRAGRNTGIRGETFAYWYLRRHGYTIVARNFTAPGLKGEIDLVGYDGKILAFIEVKTRSGTPDQTGLPEDALTSAKRHHLARIARTFRSQWRLRDVPWRFDVVAIESQPGVAPVVRLHKGAFADR